MTQFKIILDTNVYLRLGNSIHPLLFKSFGLKNYTLYLIKGFQKEFERNSRLKNKFYWVNEREYKENRQYKLNISKNNREDIKLTNSFFWEQNISENLGLSRVDAEAASYASVLNIPLVTDDKGMINLCKTHNVEVWGVLDLLELMYESEHIKVDELRAIIGYLQYNKDLPYPSFLNDLKSRFRKYKIISKLKL